MFKVEYLFALISFIFCVLVAEWTLFSLENSQERSADVRYFWTVPNLISDSSGAVFMSPHTVIREVCVADERVDFDSTFSTNNLGLIDSEDYVASDHKIKVALVGDSYTAGNGARPWVPGLRVSLQSRNPDLYLYNLGVTGTGIQHFEKLLTAFSKKIEPTHIVVLAISDDFNRISWVPSVQEDGLRFCKPRSVEECEIEKPHIPKIALGESLESVVHKWRKIQLENALYDETRKNQKVKRAEETDSSFTVKSVFRFLMKYSSILRACNRIRHSLFDDQIKINSQYLKMNLDALSLIRKRYSDKQILFLQFPSKMESSREQYALHLGEEVIARGVKYIDLWDSCEFPIEQYHNYDHHFHGEGYKLFSSCVENIIDRFINDNL